MIAAATTESRTKTVRIISDFAPIPVARAGATDDDDDAALVRRCKKGDVNAYRQLVARHERRVLSIVSRVLPTRRPGGETHPLSEVEDLAQEVFVLAWRALPTFRGDARFSTWLYRIATNRAIKEWRRTTKQPGRGWADSEFDSDRSARATFCAERCIRVYDPEAQFQLGVRDEELRHAIDALSEKHRIVVLLHYFEEYSCEEIAHVLKCSVGTVWSRLHYACRKLRFYLNEAEIS